MSLTRARALVARLKDDEQLRKAVRSMDLEAARSLVQQEGYDCTAEEIRDAYDGFGCSVTGPRSAWRDAVAKVCGLPLRYPGTPFRAPECCCQADACLAEDELTALTPREPPGRK